MEAKNGVPSLLKPSQIAEVLNVSDKTIYYWVERNEIPFLKVGRHLRFVAADVIRFYSERTAQATPGCLPDRSEVKNKRPSSLKTGALAKSRGFASDEEE